MLLPADQQYLLSLARRSIEHFLSSNTILTVSEFELSSRLLLEPRATFVTLTKDFELRGCMGTIEAVEPLYQSVLKNSVAAAFEDSRFFPVSTLELPELSIEISILSPAKKLTFTSPQDMLEQLEVGVDGVILECDGKSATFLPQVWDELLDKVEFMTALSVKAGLLPDAWRGSGVVIYTYNVEVFSENK